MNETQAIVIPKRNKKAFCVSSSSTLPEIPKRKSQKPKAKLKEFQNLKRSSPHHRFLINELLFYYNCQEASFHKIQLGHAEGILAERKSALKQVFFFVSYYKLS